MRRILLLVLVSFVLFAPACSSSGEQVRSDQKAAEDVDWPPNADHEPRNLTPVESEAETVLIENATVMTAAGDVYDNGSVLMRDGKLVEVASGSLEAPEEATVIDADGKFVTPGIIDTHSHMGVYPEPGVGAHSDGNESTSPTTPEVDAANGTWPQDPALGRALAGGVTAIQILPGSANIVGGRAVTLEMHPGISTQAMAFDGAPDGLKIACGENPKRVYGSRGQMPSTRMGNMAVFRSAFQDAREKKRTYEEYRSKLADWKNNPNASPDDKPTPPSRDFGTETLIDAMEGDILVHAHCYRADEMVQLLQLADEFDFRIRSFHHALEAYKIRDILAKWDVSVSTWADWWGYKMEMHDAIPQNAGLIEDAGGRAIIHSDSPVDVQRLNQEAAKAYYAALRGGLEITENEALRWITANAAWALGIHNQTGTLEAGKRADVVLWSDHPFSVYAKAEKVWVEGVREYDIKRDGYDNKEQPWSDFEAGQPTKDGE